MRRHAVLWFAALLLGVLWSAPLPHRLDVGRFDSGALQGWYPVEYGAGTSFRWSEPTASVVLHGVGAGSYDVVVSASSSSAQELLLNTGTAPVTVSVVPGFAPYTLPLTVPVQLTDAVTVTLHAPQALNDGRRLLGVALDDVRLVPHGWHWPPLPAWAVSVWCVWLLAGLLRGRLAWRYAAAAGLVAAGVVLRRGDAAQALSLVATVTSLVLAVRHAQRWSVWVRRLLPLAVIAGAGLLLWFRGADVWQPLYQVTVLIGAVAVLRLRRWWWHHLWPQRGRWAALVWLVALWQAWPLGVGIALLAGLAWWGRRTPPRGMGHTVAAAWWSVVVAVQAWLGGVRFPAARSTPRQYWYGLALLRGVVVLIVMLGHTPTLVIYAHPWVTSIVHWGVRFAVEGFFVLSGWLIGDLLVAELARWGEPRTVLLFLHRRWTRTLPLYWCVLLMVGIAGWSGATAWDLLPYTAFVQNMFQPHPPFFLVAWSLSIEEWFYVLTALLLAITARRLSGQRALLVTLLVLLLGPLAARSWYALATDWSWNDVIRQLVPFRLDAIAAGVALVWAWRRWPRLQEYRRHILFGGIGLGVGYLGAVQSWAPVWEQVGWVRVTLVPVMTLVTLALFPFLAQLQRPLPTRLEQWLVAVSAMSYPLYLLHYPVRQTVLGLSGTVGSAAILDAAVTVTYALGALWVARRWHEEVEQPLLRLRLRA